MKLMKKKIFTIIGVLLLIVVLVKGYFLIASLSNFGNPTGTRPPDSPYFITTGPTKVKNITVPKGTKLTYEEHFFKEGQQYKIMNEEKLTNIKLPEGKTINWGGVPVYMIVKFFNPEMPGFTIYPDFSQLNNDKESKVSKLWQSSQCDLGLLVKNTSDWTFNTKNITGVCDCGFKNRRFLDELFNELKKLN